jgi:hypothetical protein
MGFVVLVFASLGFIIPAVTSLTILPRTNGTWLCPEDKIHACCTDAGIVIFGEPQTTCLSLPLPIWLSPNLYIEKTNIELTGCSIGVNGSLITGGLLPPNSYACNTYGSGVWYNLCCDTVSSSYLRFIFSSMQPGSSPGWDINGGSNDDRFYCKAARVTTVQIL